MSVYAVCVCHEVYTAVCYVYVRILSVYTVCCVCVFPCSWGGCRLRLLERLRVIVVAHVAGVAFARRYVFCAMNLRYALSHSCSVSLVLVYPKSLDPAVVFSTTLVWRRRRLGSPKGTTRGEPPFVGMSDVGEALVEEFLVDVGEVLVMRPWLVAAMSLLYGRSW